MRCGPAEVFWEFLIFDFFSEICLLVNWKPANKDSRLSVQVAQNVLTMLLEN